MSRPGRIILFNPATWRGVGDLTVPWGLVSITTLLPPDIEVIFLDQRFDRNWKGRVVSELSRGALLAATTAMTGVQLSGALEFLRLVKRNSSVPTVLGGIHASILPRETAAHEAIDFVVVGDGEETFPKLVNSLARGRSPEVDFKYNVVQDLNALPFPPWQRFPMSRYVSSSPYGRSLSVLTSRGCPHSCAFCVNSNKTFPRRWRALSAARSVELMLRLSRELNVKHLHIQDDNFFASPQRVEEIADRLVTAGVPFSWTVGGAHIAHLRSRPPSFFSKLRRAGCVRLLIGSESGSQKILDSVGKKQTVEDILTVNELLLSAGIRPIHSFISGVPGEDESDMAATVRLMSQLRSSSNRVDVGTIKPLIFYPGTRLYSWALANGFVPPATVEGWSSITWDHYLDLPYPWLARDRRRFLIQLYYTSLLWNPEYHWVNSRVFTAVARSVFSITDYRMRNLDFRGAVLPDVLRWLQHKVLSF